MIKPSTRATMAVHHSVDTLIIISLPHSEPSAPHPRPPTHLLPTDCGSHHLLKGGDFVINSIFPSSCSYLLPDPDAPTAAYANGAPFQRHKHQLQRGAFPPHIHLETVGAQCLIKTCVTLAAPDAH